MKNYKCGRCSYSCDDLQEFGAHPCTGDNPMLAALALVIALPDFTIDLAKTVRDSIEQHKAKSAVDRIENALRHGEL